jgi:hypothetical protein
MLLTASTAVALDCGDPITAGREVPTKPAGRSRTVRSERERENFVRVDQVWQH